MTDLAKSGPIRFSDLTKSPWPNGAGRKADVAAALLLQIDARPKGQRERAREVE